jgi:hypothetical protein
MRSRPCVWIVAALLVTGCGPAAGAPARPSVQSFLSLLEAAADAAPAGVAARDLGDDPVRPASLFEAGASHASERMPSCGFSGTTESVFGFYSVARRFDWRKAVAVAAKGAPEVAIAQADAQAAVLAQAGFVPLDAGSTEADAGGARVAWSVKRRDGGSGSVAALQPLRLVHRRIYYAAGTSAFVIARNEYEAASGVATVELTCVEASPDAADRDPRLRTPVRETLTNTK